VSHSSTRGAMRLGYISGYKPTSPVRTNRTLRVEREGRYAAHCREKSCCNTCGVMSAVRAPPRVTALVPTLARPNLFGGTEGQRDRGLESGDSKRGHLSPLTVPEIYARFRRSDNVHGQKGQRGHFLIGVLSQRFPSRLRALLMPSPRLASLMLSGVVQAAGGTGPQADGVAVASAAGADRVGLRRGSQDHGGNGSRRAARGVA
jgi:hypothetical protein